MTWVSTKFYEKFYRTLFSLNYQLSDQVHYSVVASRTSNQAWSKGYRRRYML